MRTAAISDLHLGVLSRRDLARDGHARDRLLGTLVEADRLVLLGDTIELRERPLHAVLDEVRPFFEALGEAFAGRPILVVPGNHDHALASPWLTRLRLEGREVSSEQEWPVEAGDAALGRIASWMPEVELSVAYAGVWLRPDVYATHGHYLDLNLTVPRIESIAASLMGRLTGGGRDCNSAREYEAVLAPMYVFHLELAQGSSRRAFARGGHVSRDVWRRLNGKPGSIAGGAGRFLIGSVTIPTAVLALNRLGFGPFSAELTGEELRRSGLLAMGRVADALALGADHVVFGHTHRPGPLPGDELAEWTTLAGARLWNTGSWFFESVLTSGARDSPYWPGTVLWLDDDDGPPRLENELRDVALAL
ncbi:MAG TPA: metallophosphoesterase [Thermoleophilaceae bacterium]|nr:metallophosphoesterase [Thermoleophilaceae bacterium]